MAIISALMSTCGFFLFFEHVLAGPDSPRHFSRLMKAGAVLSVLVAIVHALDGIDTRRASSLVGMLGTLPFLLTLPGALMKLRKGDAMSVYIVLGALVYFSAVVTMTGLIYGRIDVSFWTQHSVQLAALLDTLLLMRLLDLRSKAIRHAAQRAAQERDAMHSLAYADPLTGLANRRGLNAALTTALPQCSTDRILAVYVLDLDGFKPVNDRHGHDVGDELLAAVAGRLRSLTRNSDVVARMGGDEFVILASGLHNGAQAIDLGNKLLDAFRKPFDLSGLRCQVGLTIGYALAPLDGCDPRTLLKRADAGMYLGKQEGKHCLRRFDPESNALLRLDGALAGARPSAYRG